VAWIPKEVHARIRQLILLNKRSMAHYVVRGLRYMLAQASKEIPREYFDSLVEKEAFERSARRLRTTAGTMVNRNR
jgi:hypothetical protein